MSASTSSTAPEPWGRCNKGCGPSLLSDMAATLQQQQNAARPDLQLDITAIRRILHGFHVHAMVHSGHIFLWMNACACFRGSAGVVLEHTATPRGATQHPRAAYRQPSGSIPPPPGQHSENPMGACFPVSVFGIAPGRITAHACRTGGDCGLTCMSLSLTQPGQACILLFEHCLCTCLSQLHCCCYRALLLALSWGLSLPAPVDVDGHPAMAVHSRQDRIPVRWEMPHCLQQLSPSSSA